jgi:AraC-like DNA-binding protein
MQVLLLRIKHFRRRGWSARQIAQQIGCSKSHVCRLLRRRVLLPLLPSGPRRRCPHCGAVVLWPCRRCQLQNELSAISQHLG